MRDDPLIAASLCNIFAATFRTRWGSRTRSRRRLTDQDRQENTYPAAVISNGRELADESMQIQTTTLTSARSVELDKRVIELTKESTELAGDLCTGEMNTDGERLQRKCAASGVWIILQTTGEAIRAEVCAGSKVISEWVPFAPLRGAIETKRAWDKRGTGYVNTVTTEGWQGFNELCDLARDDYNAAWKLHPTRPDAARGHGSPSPWRTMEIRATPCAFGLTALCPPSSITYRLTRRSSGGFAQCGAAAWRRCSSSRGSAQRRAALIRKSPRNSSGSSSMPRMKLTGGRCA